MAYGTIKYVVEIDMKNNGYYIAICAAIHTLNQDTWSCFSGQERLAAHKCVIYKNH